MGFPPVGEPPQPGELRGLGPAGEQPERAAGLDGGQLVLVPDQEDLRAGCLGLGDQVVQLEGPGQGRLVDDQELAGFQAPLGLLED